MPTNNRGTKPPSDDEDDFFKPTSNSNLAKIFGASKVKVAEPGSTVPKPTANKISDRYGASSFRYVPPPEALENNSAEENSEGKSSAEWSLVHASVVIAYKLVNNENTAQGKLGLALLSLGAEYRILIYRTKTDALATLNLVSTSKIFIKNEYLQFRTDDECIWSIMFENSADRDRLLMLLQNICIIHTEKHRVPPLPSSRIIPIVEEPDSDIEKSKASLISRMARVGQPILPKDKPLSNTEVSDSSDTDTRFETIARSNVPPHRRVASGNSGKLQPISMGMQMIPSAANALTTAIAGQNMLHTATDVNLNLFMSENRMQNTEVRMNFSKLESKLDRVLDKIDAINLNSVGGSSEKSSIEKDDEILLLEEKIFKLKKENHELKVKLRALESETIVEENRTLLKVQLTESESQNKHLREEVVTLKNDLEAMRSSRELSLKEIDRLQTEIYTTNQTILEKTKEVDFLTKRLEEVQNREALLNETKLDMAKQLEEANKISKSMEQQLKSFQSNTHNSESIDELVKTIMNSCFQRISEEIDDSRTLKTIGQVIKQETKAALARLSKE